MASYGPFLSVLSSNAPLTGLAQRKTPPLDPPQIPLRTRESEALREPHEKKNVMARHYFPEVA